MTTKDPLQKQKDMDKQLLKVLATIALLLLVLIVLWMRTA